MNKLNGFLYGLLSSASFGLIPLFTIPAMREGMNFESILFYRFLFACLALGCILLLDKQSFHIKRKEIPSLMLLAFLYLMSAVFLFWGYKFMASGVATTIHFMYPLAVALAMMCFFREKGSVWVFAAIGMSIVDAVLLSLGNVDFTRGNTTLGMVSAAVSVVSYGGYIVGVRKSRAVGIDSTVLTCYVMGLGALYFIAGGLVTGGIRIETDGTAWLCILGVALPATAVSNMTLVQAIKRIGPTLTSVFGALEPLTAVVIGVAVFGEPFTVQGAAGILLIVAAVTIVILHSGRRKA